MFTFLLWCILFVVCWPLALLALVLYPFVWVLLLPFRLVGIAVHGALALVWAVVMLPATAAERAISDLRAQRISRFSAKVATATWHGSVVPFPMPLAEKAARN